MALVACVGAVAGVYVVDDSLAHTPRVVTSCAVGSLWMMPVVWQSDSVLVCGVLLYFYRGLLRQCSAWVSCGSSWLSGTAAGAIRPL
jgi:hypothetical protein